MPAPTIVSTSTAVEQTGATFTISAPGSITNGNLLVAFQVNNGAAPTTPTGWTLLGGTANVTFGTTPPFACLSQFYKVAASEPGSYTFNAPSMMSASNAYILNISGSLTVPDDFDGNTGTGTTATALSYPTLVANELVVCAYATFFGIFGGGITLPGTLTSLAEIGGVSTSLKIGYLTQATASDPGNQAATLSMSRDWATIFTTIQPSGSGGGGIVDEDGMTFSFRVIW